MIKKFGILFLAAILAFSMIACDSETKAPSTPDTNTPETPDENVEISLEEQTLVGNSVMELLINGMKAGKMDLNADDEEFVSEYGNFQMGISLKKTEESYSEGNKTLLKKSVAGIDGIMATTARIGIIAKVKIDNDQYNLKGVASCTLDNSMLMGGKVQNVDSNSLVMIKNGSISTDVDDSVVIAMLEAVPGALQTSSN